MATDKKAAFGVLEGTLAYAKIAQADSKYQSKDTEYSIQVIVDEDTADAWDEQFKKQPAKKIKASDFEGKYKFPCPIEGAKNVYAISLKKDATKDGVPFFPEHRPKVFLDTEDERVEITESRLIANGSVGKVSYRISTNDFGTFAKLNNVLLDEAGFKEYVSTSGGAGSEFEGSSKPVRKETPRKDVTEARKAKVVEEVEEDEEVVKPKPKAKKVVDDSSEESPF